MAFKLVIAVVDAAVGVYDASKQARARKREADRAYDTRRPHLWDEETPPSCGYCAVEQTHANAFALCPATGDPPRFR